MMTTNHRPESLTEELWLSIRSHSSLIGVVGLIDLIELLSRLGT